MRNLIRNMLHILVIVALTSALASPACAFIAGGKTLWNICANQSVDDQTQIEIDADLAKLIVSSDTDQQSPEPPDHYSEQCQFCFASSHVAKHIAVIKSYEALTNIARAKNIFTSKTPSAETTLLRAYQTRAPPTFS